MSKINKKRLFSRERLLAATGLAFLVLLSMSSSISAQSIGQAYSSDEKLQRGMLVAVKEGDPNKVEAVTDKSLDRLKGIVVQPNDLSITLNSGDRNIYVASSGAYETLVSDQSGSIKAGDYISISSLAGIGMKATDSQKVVVGKAVEGFNGRDNTVGSSTAEGGQRVNFGRIRVEVSVNKNPWLKVPEAPKVPSFLGKLSQTIVSKQVSAPRIYLATAVFLATIFITGVMLYSGSRGGMISIGRNPLSRKVVTKVFLQVVLFSLIIFITGLFGVYLLLKL